MKVTRLEFIMIVGASIISMVALPLVAKPLKSKFANLDDDITGTTITFSKPSKYSREDFIKVSTLREAFYIINKHYLGTNAVDLIAYERCEIRDVYMYEDESRNKAVSVATISWPKNDYRNHTDVLTRLFQ